MATNCHLETKIHHFSEISVCSSITCVEFPNTLFQGKPDGDRTLHTGGELEHIIKAARKGMFDGAGKLCKRGLVDGVFARFELSFTFWRGRLDYDLWSNVRFRVEPHLNLLVNSRELLGLSGIRIVYKTLVDRLPHHLAPSCRWSYPDLWFAPIVDEKGMAAWIGYMLKAGSWDKWYQDALNRRCDRWELNVLFDEVVFEGGHRLAHPKSASRRYGNLNPKKLARYIAHKVPEPVTQEQIRLLKDDNYAAAHPDLVEAMLFWMEKRRKCQGRRHDESKAAY